MQPLPGLDLAGSMFGCPDPCARSASGCASPSLRTCLFSCWTRRSEVLAVQLANFNALLRFAIPRIGRPAAARPPLLEVSSEVLNRMIGGPS